MEIISAFLLLSPNPSHPPLPPIHPTLSTFPNSAISIFNLHHPKITSSYQRLAASYLFPNTKCHAACQPECATGFARLTFSVKITPHLRAGHRPPSSLPNFRYFHYFHFQFTPIFKVDNTLYCYAFDSYDAVDAVLFRLAIIDDGRRRRIVSLSFSTHF